MGDRAERFRALHQVLNEAEMTGTSAVVLFIHEGPMPEGPDGPTN